MNVSYISPMGEIAVRADVRMESRLTAWFRAPPSQHLEAKFGNAYRDYKTRVRRWI